MIGGSCTQFFLVDFHEGVNVAKVPFAALPLGNFLKFLKNHAELRRKRRKRRGHAEAQRET